MAGEQELTGLLVRIRADLSDYVLKLAEFDRQTGGATNKAAVQWSKVGTYAATAAAAVTAAAGVAMKSAIEWGKAVDDLSDKTGMAGEESSKFLVIAKRTGMDLQTANTMWSRFAKNVFEAADAQVKAANSGKQAEDVLSMLKINAIDPVTGSMRSATEVFQDVKNKLNAMPDGLQKTALEMKLFGKSGAEMHDILHMSNSEMQAAWEKANALGLIMSTKAAAGIEQFDRNLNTAKGTLTGLGMAIAIDAMPQIQELLDLATKSTKVFIEWKNANPELASSLFKVAEGIAAIAAAIKLVSLFAVKIPQWAIPLLVPAGTAAAVGVGVAGGGVAAHRWNTEQAQKAVAVGQTPQFDPVTGLAIPVTAQKMSNGIGSLKEFESESRGYADKPEDHPDPFLGGGNGGKNNTALEAWIKANNDAMQIMQLRLELGKIDQTQFDEFVRSQLAGLEIVAVGEDETNKKLLEELGLRKKLSDSIKKQAEAVADYFMNQAQREGEDVQRRLDEQIRGYEDEYRHEIRIAEAKATDKKALLDQLIAEEQRYYQVRDQLSADDQLKEATRETLRADTIKELNREIEIDAIETSRRVNEEWSSNLAELASGTMTWLDFIRQQWNKFIFDVLSTRAKFGGSGNIFTDILGGIFGLGTSTSAGSSLNNALNYAYGGGRAEGGDAVPGKWYNVNEKGLPEVFVPNVPGVILPMSRLSSQTGGNSQTVILNQTFQGATDPAIVAQLKQAGRQTEAVVKNLLKNDPATRNLVKGAAR